MTNNVVTIIQQIFLGIIAFSTAFIALQAPIITCTTSFCLFANGDIHPIQSCVPNSGGQPYTLQGTTSLADPTHCRVAVLGTTIWGPRN